MPQIIIEHDIPLNDTTCEKLVEVLSNVCSQLFSVGNWTLEPSDFGFKFEPPSHSTHNVIVRITLHSFEARVMQGDTHATLIRNAVLNILHGAHPDMPWRTVGVSLTYALVAWSSGTYDDVP